MDWRINKRRRNRVSKLAQKDAEFELLVQRTIRRIAIVERIRDTVRLFQWSSDSPQKVSWWKSFTRNFSDL